MPIIIEGVTIARAIDITYEDSLRYAKYHVKNVEQAEDILHDVIEKLLVRHEEMNNYFESTGKFLGFIRVSVRNRFLDEKRKEKRSLEERFDNETFRIIMRYSQSDLRTDQVFEDEYEALVRRVNKTKFIATRSHLDNIQYLVTTLRMNDYSFKQISELTGASISTSLAQMRYSRLHIKKRFDEKRVREKRRRRFKEGRDGTATRDKMFMKLPPYQFFVLKMKETGMRFKDIAELEGIPTSTAYYRWKWARKNLKKCAKSYEDYVDAIEYLDSLNTNVGGANWHKPK